MSQSVVLLLVMAVVALVNGMPNTSSEDLYPSRLDLIDVDAILGNERLAESYFKCLMDQGRCTNEGTELKKRLPEALTNNCSKCTEPQKNNVEKAIAYLSKNRKQHWKQLLTKYDPEGKWLASYEERQKKLVATTSA